MTTFFFYNNLTNPAILSKISPTFDCADGYAMVQEYDPIMPYICVNEVCAKNSIRLNGKVVSFDLTLDAVLARINGIPECKGADQYKTYTVQPVAVHIDSGEPRCAFIIY
jgi:hypothetical protein